MSSASMCSQKNGGKKKTRLLFFCVENKTKVELIVVMFDGRPYFKFPFRPSDLGLACIGFLYIIQKNNNFCGCFF